MSVENVLNFVKRLETDAEFRTEFMQDKRLKDNKAESLFLFVAEKGYEFTDEDIRRVLKEQSSQ
ncbi:MAG: Nif11 family protein [Deferribacterales bacterium]